MRSVLRFVAAACLASCSLPGADPPQLTEEARAFIEIHFLAAKRAEADNDFAKATDEYESILRKYPRLVPAVYQNLGLVYYVLRKYDQAIETLSQAVELDATMVGARLFLGDAYLDTEQPSKALPHLEYAYKHKPDAESATALGLAYSALRQYDKAARYFRSGLEQSTQKEEQLYLIGQSYLKLSEALATSLAEQNPDSKYDHLLTAKILDSQERYQMAAREYLEAGKKDPSNAAVFFPLARMLAILGLQKASDLALERYRRLMVVDRQATLDTARLPRGQAADVGPKTDYEAELKVLPPVDPAQLSPLPILNSDINVEVRKRLAADPTGRWKNGADRMLHGRWHEAIAAVDKMEAGDWLRDYLVATAYLWNEEYHKAEEAAQRPALASRKTPAVQALRWEVSQQLSYVYLNRLVEEFPQSARAHYVKGRALDAQGKKEAEQEYRAALANDPTQSEARIALADYLLSNSKYEEALAECQKALELNNHVSPAKLRIGRIYIQLRDPRKGIPYIEAVLRNDPDDAQARADLARGFELLGDVDKAVAEYRRSLALDPSLNRIHYVLGRIYRRQGKTALADTEFQTFERNEARDRGKRVDGLKNSGENR